VIPNQMLTFSKENQHDHLTHLDVIRPQQPLIALESLMQVPQRDRHVAHPFFHHRNVDVGGCRVRMLRTTDEVKQVQSPVDVPAEEEVKGFKRL
jgi:hypothetical protein